jgi:hypothetical protein
MRLFAISMPFGMNGGFLRSKAACVLLFSCLRSYLCFPVLSASSVVKFFSYFFVSALAPVASASRSNTIIPA